MPRPGAGPYVRCMRWFSRAAAAAAWLGSAVFALGLWIFAPQLAKPPLLSALVILVALVPLVSCVVVTRAAPRNSAGPLLASAGFVAVTTNLVNDDAVGPWAGCWMLLYLSFAILLLVVPSGHVASRRWAAVGWTLVVVVASVHRRLRRAVVRARDVRCHESAGIRAARRILHPARGVRARPGRALPPRRRGRADASPLDLPRGHVAAADAAPVLDELPDHRVGRPRRLRAHPDVRRDPGRCDGRDRASRALRHRPCDRRDRDGDGARCRHARDPVHRLRDRRCRARAVEPDRRGHRRRRAVRRHRHPVPAAAAHARSTPVPRARAGCGGTRAARDAGRGGHRGTREGSGRPARRPARPRIARRFPRAHRPTARAARRHARAGRRCDGARAGARRGDRGDHPLARDGPSGRRRPSRAQRRHWSTRYARMP